MVYKIQDHLYSGDDERRPVTPPHFSYFLFTNILSPPYLHSFHSIKRKQSWAICPPHFWWRQASSSKLHPLTHESWSLEDYKIRFVPPLFFFFYSALWRQHQKSAANRRHWGKRLSARPMINFHTATFTSQFSPQAYTPIFLNTNTNLGFFEFWG